MKTIVRAVLAGAATAAFAVAVPENPVGAAAHTPDLLTAYQREILRLELVRLQSELRAASTEAGADEALVPLREALAKAKAGGDEREMEAASRALAAAAETNLVSRFPEVLAKRKRLADVGLLLEYDTRRRKDQRAVTGGGAR